jgi:hypothetical protein
MPKYGSAGVIRAPQLVGMHGPGAIVNLERLSVMPLDPQLWPTSRLLIESPTFSRQIAADALIDTSSLGKSGIPTTLFPRVFVCRECGFVQRHNRARAEELHHGLQCARRDGALYPSRWIVYCERGHIDDFDYFGFVHRGKCEGSVTLESRASLSETIVRCDLCGVSRPMLEAYGNVKRGKCTGQRPWTNRGYVDCDATPRLSMRSASDVYFAAIRSAITIEPEANPDYRRIMQYLGPLNVDREYALDLLQRHAEFRTLPEHVLQRAVDIVLDKRDQPYRDRLNEEFVSFCSPSGNQRSDLWVEEVAADEYRRFGIAQVMAVRKLREVRAIVGFQRGAMPLDPTFNRDESGAQPVCGLGESRQFPAYENRGEGIFVRLDSATLASFLQQPSSIARAEMFRDAEDRLASRDGASHETPRRAAYILAHSLAHIAIRQLSLTCGYSQSSLRERIFVGSDEELQPWAGFLVYTSSSDADGSLGGVVAQAIDGKFASMLERGLEDLAVCSSDPICALQLPNQFRKLNGAACHNCLILPETCCERNNRFLDRVVAVPSTVNDQSDDLCFIKPA